MIRLFILMWIPLFGADYFEARLEDSKVHFNFIMQQLQIPPECTNLVHQEIEKALNMDSNHQLHFYSSVDQLASQEKISAETAMHLKKSWENSFGYLLSPNEVQSGGFDSKADNTEKRKMRARIYEETKAACLHGYRTDTGRLKPTKIAEMQEGTFVVESLPPLIRPAPYANTTVKVFPEDTVDLTHKLQKLGFHPVALNFANKHHVGGGVTRGASAQEESIFRRSSYCFGLDIKYNAALDKILEGKYRIPEFGAIYTPQVEVIRNAESAGYGFTHPFEVDFIASASYDLSPGKSDAPIQHEAYLEGMRNKIRNILRLAVKTDHDSIVLGAFGCGAFNNDPVVIATLFKEVIHEKEFVGQFRLIAFGILESGNHGKYMLFKNVLEDTYRIR